MVLIVQISPIPRLGRMFMARPPGGPWHVWGYWVGCLLRIAAQSGGIRTLRGLARVAQGGFCIRFAKHSAKNCGIFATGALSPDMQSVDSSVTLELGRSQRSIPEFLGSELLAQPGRAGRTGLR